MQRHASLPGADGGEGIDPPYYRTNDGEWGNSDSLYGTFDQGGNVWEWNEAGVGSFRGARDGSIYYYANNLHAADRSGYGYPASGGYSVGSRVAEVP